MMNELSTGKNSILDIRKMMSNIRRLGGTVLTNYYNQCNDQKDEFLFWATEKALAFVWEDEGIKRVYFYAIDLDELVLVLRQPEKGSVVDFLMKQKEAERKTLFPQAGYRLYLEYGRFYIDTGQMSTKAKELRKEIEGNKDIKESLYNNTYGEMAKESDAEEIDRQLREKFDPYEAHFYSMKKLRDHIRKGWVWVAKADGKIVAAYLFEIQGNKAYGAYLYNYSGVDVLQSLLARVNAHLEQYRITYTYCWMRLDNKRIIRYNIEYNGFVPDGLYDMIYVKE